MGENAMAAVPVRLTEFSDLIERYTADFVGRKWLETRLETLLAETGCRIVVLSGGPGVGKTAFLAHLAAMHIDWLRYFIRRDSRQMVRPGDAKSFLLTVGGQLATIRPASFHPENLKIIVRQRVGSVETGGQAVAARIQELRASPFYKVSLDVEQEISRSGGRTTAIEIGQLIVDPRQLSMQDLQFMSLLDPAKLLGREDPNARITVLVDALDELRYSPAETDLARALCEMPELPANLRFVVSSRNENPEVVGRLLARTDARHLHIDFMAGDNLGDLRQYYAERVSSDPRFHQALGELHSQPSTFADELLGKAAGSFLYLRSVLDAILEALDDNEKRNQLPALLNVEGLPGDLPGSVHPLLDGDQEMVRAGIPRGDMAKVPMSAARHLGGRPRAAERSPAR